MLKITVSLSGETSSYLPATQTGLNFYGFEKMKSKCLEIKKKFRRVPGLGTALTKAALKDVEEQGVKVWTLDKYFPNLGQIFFKLRTNIIKKVGRGGANIFQA